MKKLGEIVPYQFEGKLLISLEEKWVNFFGQIPKFTISLKDDQLVLTSQRRNVK